MNKQEICKRATHSLMGFTEDFDLLFSKQEELRLTVVFSVHWENLRKNIRYPNSDNSQHFHLEMVQRRQPAKICHPAYTHHHTGTHRVVVLSKRC